MAKKDWLNQTYKFRISNSSGELIGYISAKNEAEAARKASIKYGGFGITVRQV